MGFFVNITLQDSIEIHAAPEKIFEFITGLVDDESYRAWHPEDHMALRWIKGAPWHENSIVYAEEVIHGKLHKLKFRIQKVVPNREIQYTHKSPLIRFYFPQNSFQIEPNEDDSIFTATGRLRVGWPVKMFARRKLEAGCASIKRHMHEEGENLKRILEA